MTNENFIPFNINETVRVKLTPRGRAIHKADHIAFWKSAGPIIPEYDPPEEDANGWSKWQLWTLMEAFGKHTRLGSLPCFETTIELYYQKLSSNND